MRFPSPKLSFRIRYSPFDVIWAALSPPIALYLRAVDIGGTLSVQGAELYCAVTFAAALVAFLIFRIREGIAHHFSVHDALEVGKAVVVAEFLSTLALFGAVRLEAIPRSTPVIHALLLAAGLLVYRVIVRMRHEDPVQKIEPSPAAPQQILMLGSTRLTSLYMRMIKAYAPQQFKVVGIVDDNPRNVGESVDGVRVVGEPDQIETIVKEFAEHGVAIDRLIAGGDRTLFASQEWDTVERACADLGLTLEFIPSLIGLDSRAQAAVDTVTAAPPEILPDIALPRYFRFKRVADIFVGLLLLILLFPVFLIVACIVLLDVGSPILFWQQRIGSGGKPFLLYKFRTLKPLFNELGLPIGTSDRMSWAGAFERRPRLDELPQLLNVLVGDMSLVGPRPLLPRDQPPDPSVRLLIKPGLTGWAQVNGGKSLTAEKKNEYDEWYVRNASMLLDVRILWRTFGFIVRGESAEPQPGMDTHEMANSNL